MDSPNLLEAATIDWPETKLTKLPLVSVKSISPDIRLTPPEISPVKGFRTAIIWNMVPRILAVPKGLLNTIVDPLFNLGAFTISSPKSK